MISGIGAYQQQIQSQQQATQQAAQSRDASRAARERDQDLDEKVVVSRSRGEEATKSSESNKADDARQAQLVASNANSSSGGKDAAQKRGSILDITV